MTTKKKATRKARPRKTTKAQKPAWVYILTGLLIGLFIAGVVYVSKQPASEVNLKEEVRNTTRTVVDKTDEIIDKKLDDIDDSEFFKALPNIDHLPLNGLPQLPDSTQKNTSKITPQITPQPLPKSEISNTEKSYIIQVGSFANFEYADEQKAQLILNNWSAFIQTATLDDGRERFRVYVGTFNKNDLPDAKTRLAQMGVKNPLVLNAQ